MKITVRKLLYVVVFMLLVIAFGEITRILLNIEDRLPLVIDAIVFVVAFICAEILDNAWIKSQIWGTKDNEKQ